jgi:hypothetical protein
MFNPITLSSRVKTTIGFLNGKRPKYGPPIIGWTVMATIGLVTVLFGAVGFVGDDIIERWKYGKETNKAKK